MSAIAVENQIFFASSMTANAINALLKRTTSDGPNKAANNRENLLLIKTLNSIPYLLSFPIEDH